MAVYLKNNTMFQFRYFAPLQLNTIFWSVFVVTSRVQAVEACFAFCLHFSKRSAVKQHEREACVQLGLCVCVCVCVPTSS